MDRFNQGFGGFGIMEQCDDGKWVKAEEAFEIIDALDAQLEEKFAAAMDWQRFYEKTLNDYAIAAWERNVAIFVAVVGWGLLAGVVFTKVIL